MISTKELKKLYNARKLMEEMMEDRKYELVKITTDDNEEEKTNVLFESFEDFVNKCVENNYKPEKIMRLLYKKSNLDYTIIIFISAERKQKINKDTLNGIVQFFDKTNETPQLSKIIVSDDTMANNKKYALFGMQPNNLDDGYNYRLVQFFNYDELLINPTKNIFVPKHTFLSLRETEKYCRENNLTPGNLPIIYDTDVICKWYGARENQLCIIGRTNFVVDTMIEKSLYYRFVKKSK